MPRIFAESDSVAIWIGEGNELTTWALDIISKLNGVLRFASDMSIRELKAIVNLHPDRDPCVHLRDLFRSGWWTRIWVVQEVALAPRAILLYGERSVTLDAISQLARHHRTVKSALESVLPLNLDSATLWESAEWQRAAGLASITFSMRTGESQLAFSRLFYLTRYRKFSQPQDRFYSLFGMLPSEDYDRLVDYSLSLRQCVQRVFAAVMTQEQSLDMLSFLPQQEMDHTAESLPSWTSSGVWDERVTYAVPLLADLEDENTRLHFHASPHPAEPSFDPPDTLSIDGWHIADLETHTDEDTASREPFFAAVFAAGYAKFADQRSLYTTTHGHRCLVPLDSVPGDSMFILAGGKTPYVLRQRPSGKFRLVGEW